MIVLMISLNVLLGLVLTKSSIGISCEEFQDLHWSRMVLKKSSHACIYDSAGSNQQL